MFLHQILQPLIYTGSDYDEEIADVISVSTAICQLSKGEDVVPQFEKNETHVACMVGDGHSGTGCKEILDANSGTILHCMLHTGLKDAMQMCLQLCEDETSGAMVVLTLYTIAERKLSIASVGDASCTVYQHNKLIHAQPHHNCATVAASGELVQEMQDQGISIESSNRPTMVPSSDGAGMTIEMKPGYFIWGLGQNIGAGSFVGHRNMGRLAPFITECLVPEGDFHLVMASDGVSDMVHPADRLLSTIDVTATAIAEDAKLRWTVPYFKPITQKAFEKYNKDGFFVLNPYSTTISKTANFNGKQMRIKQVVAQQENEHSKVEFINGAISSVSNSSIRTKEHNRGGDDISVLVMTVKST
jgi:serine/threonine protein phosphatase PrpC